MHHKKSANKESHIMAAAVGLMSRAEIALHQHLPNQWMDFDQTCTDPLLGGGKKWSDFDDLDLIFKVAPALWIIKCWSKSLSAPYLLNQMTDSGQTSYIVTLGRALGWFKEKIRFWWPSPNFQGHHTIKAVKMSLVCTPSPEPNGGFDQTCTEIPLGHGKEMIRFWWPWLHFQSHTSTLNVNFWQKKKKKKKKKSLSAPYLLNQMMDSGQIYVSLGYLKELIRFWWPWPNFQGHHTIKAVKMSLVCTLSPEPIGGFLPNFHRNTIGTCERND